MSFIKLTMFVLLSVSFTLPAFAQQEWQLARITDLDIYAMHRLFYIVGVPYVVGESQEDCGPYFVILKEGAVEKLVFMTISQGDFMTFSRKVRMDEGRIRILLDNQKKPPTIEEATDGDKYGIILRMSERDWQTCGSLPQPENTEALTEQSLDTLIGRLIWAKNNQEIGAILAAILTHPESLVRTDRSDWLFLALQRSKKLNGIQGGPIERLMEKMHFSDDPLKFVQELRNFK